MEKMDGGYAIQLPMQPKHLRSHLIKQAETTLEKVTKRVHKEGPYIFAVLIQNQPNSPIAPKANMSQAVLTVITALRI